MSLRGRSLTKTTRLHIAFFACRNIQIHIANLGALANVQLLIQTELLRARDAGVTGIAWPVDWYDGERLLEADALAERSKGR